MWVGRACGLAGEAGNSCHPLIVIVIPANAGIHLDPSSDAGRRERNGKMDDQPCGLLGSVSGVCRYDDPEASE